LVVLRVGCAVVVDGMGQRPSIVGEPWTVVAVNVVVEVVKEVVGEVAGEVVVGVVVIVVVDGAGLV
jgi:hypothetical protein